MTFVKNEDFYPNLEIITRLTGLASLTIDGCNIDGEIPTLIGELKALTSLVLENAVFNGVDPERRTIPKEIARLTNLQSLSISEFFLKGTIPRELMNLTLLTSLSLRGRTLGELAGRIPSEIGQLTRLRTLDVSHNEFGLDSGPGVIPVEISNLSNLEELNMADSFDRAGVSRTERLQTVLGTLGGLRLLNMRT